MTFKICFLRKEKVPLTNDCQELATQTSLNPDIITPRRFQTTQSIWKMPEQTSWLKQCFPSLGLLSILRVTFHRKWPSEKNLGYFIIILKAYQIFKRTWDLHCCSNVWVYHFHFNFPSIWCYHYFLVKMKYDLTFVLIMILLSECCILYPL